MNREGREKIQRTGRNRIDIPTCSSSSSCLRSSRGFVFSNSKNNLYKSSRSIAVMAIAFAPINNRS